MVLRALDELHEMEVERNMQLTSVIGWFENMLPPGCPKSHSLVRLTVPQTETEPSVDCIVAETEEKVM